jgi:hypothetical protein
MKIVAKSGRLSANLPKPSAPRNSGVAGWPDVHFRISQEHYDRLVELAKQDERSVANFVSRIVRGFLDSYKKI